ncbi:MAG: TetR/AcrR family transcriptional regulator [Reyranellaceae bacterium]
MGKAQDTKVRIERAALTLFVARGVAATTTKEIALAAGIAEGTIYRHFATKEAMAEELFLRVHTALAQELEKAQRGKSALKEKARAIVQTYCAAADADWLLFSYHLLSQHQHMIQVRIEQANPVGVVREVVRKAMAAGEIPRRDIEVLTAMVLGVVLQPAIHKVYGRIATPLSEHVEMLADGVWAALCGRPAKPVRPPRA